MSNKNTPKPQTPARTQEPIEDLIMDDRLTVLQQTSAPTSDASDAQIAGNSAETLPPARPAAAKPADPVKEAPQPYLGDANRPATAQEIAVAVANAFGDKLLALTPDPLKQAEMIGAMVEKIVRGLREPSDEEKIVLARKKEDRAKLIKEQFETIAAQKELQDMCPHERGTADGKSHTCVTALHNYADFQVRGICSMCQKIIEPGDSA
ncbi:MAG TPA: hypothetical protein VHA06_17965, partial [Candidatus Angelobacter sp.]|nr:hypothetical protein [Candidatus Angelobacter sp.]